MSNSFNWRAHVKVHPAAEAFPELEGEELQELADDIRANGMREALSYWRPDPDKPDTLLLDGRNRLNAMALAGILTVNNERRLCVRKSDGIRPIKFILREGDPYKLAISLNVRRRHLRPETKREIIAKLLKTEPEKSDRAIARQAQVDSKTVATVRDNLERRAEIPHVESRIDRAGRVQPSTKPKPIGPKPVNEGALIVKMMNGPVNEIRATLRKLSPPMRINARRQVLNAISDAMLKEPDGEP